MSANTQDFDTTQQRAPARWSFHTGAQRTPIGRSVGSELLKKLSKALTDIYTQANPEFEMVVVQLDNQNETALMYSCAVVACRWKVKGNVGVAYHTLILEGTGDKIPVRVENINGQSVEVLRVSGDAADSILHGKCMDAVARVFPGATLMSADSCVIPKGFNVEDAAAVHNLALNAGLACTTELAIQHPDFEDINLANLMGEQLQVNLQFSSTQKADAVGNPVRGDVQAVFTSQQQTQGVSHSVNNGDKVTTVSTLAGFVDVVYAPVAAALSHNPWIQQQNQPQNKQLYAARLVVTDIESIFASTPAATLLALSTVMAVREDNNWLQAFRPSQTIGDVDMRDIGALGIEANFDNNPNGVGSRVDTKGDSFRAEDLGMLVSALFQQGLVVSMDVPEAGPQSWYTNVFAVASYGDPQATRNIWNAANQLTNGAFGRLFPLGTPMFVDTHNRVHTGHYTDKHGVKRDLREIDYLAVCNMVGEKDPAAIRDWSDTFTQQQFPLAMRLQARKRIIMSLTGQTAEFTGYAQRVTFSNRFLDALSQAIRETNLNVRVITPMSSNLFNNQRGVANFVAGAMLTNNGQSFMTSGYYQNGAPMYQNNNQYYGYGRNY